MSVLLKPTGTVVRMTKDDLVIERDVPLPGARGRPRRGPHLAVQRAMETMEVNDSFVSPLGTKPTLAIAKTVRQQTGRGFATRSDFSIEPPTVRVWRVR